MKSLAIQLEAQLKLANAFVKNKEYKQAFWLFVDVLKILPRHVQALEGAIQCLELSPELKNTLDFEALDLEMRWQEHKNPLARRTRLRSSPSYAPLAKKIQLLLRSKSIEDSEKLTSELLQHGEEALCPLIDTLLAFKKMGQK